ncbi:MAG: DNA polymerase IV [Oleiphilaceae bacterium]|nr:DNA polymerase IV [Oleiphilaceae bacterium]
MQRKIIHCDADCFYAAVEMRSRPELRERPLAIGAASGRGVVTTCNYPAREYGIHSAMPMAQALQRCPHLTILPTDMARYQAVSRQMMGIFRRYTDLVEPLSLDEAYLDVSAARDFRGSATRIAQALRREVAAELGITISAGVAPNKFLAKIASDWHKPDGLCVITPGEVEAFLRPLPVTKLHGVGRVTAGKLHDLGIHTCEDLRQWSQPALAERFGRHGERLYELAWGQDERAVVVSRVRKSLSVERTFSQNLPGLPACHERLETLVEELHQRLGRKSLDRPDRAPFAKLFVKLRFADFSTHTRETLWQRPGLPVESDFAPLLDHLYGQEESRGVRLLGLGVRLAQADENPRQLTLFAPPAHQS